MAGKGAEGIAGAPSGAQRVVVVAPRGRDAPLIRAQLAKAGVGAEPCQGPEELRRVLADDPGALLLTAEALSPELLATVVESLAAQAPWSDLPLIVLVSGKGQGDDTAKALGAHGNVTVLERPLSLRSLLTVVRSALRARQRQYQLRDLLAERQALNEHLQSRTATLEALNHELEAFSYSVSHDLRAPLRRISGFGQALAEEYGEKLDETGRRYLARIDEGARHMGQLIEGFLKLSQLARGELRRRPVDLAALATRVAARLREQQPGREVVFSVGELPLAEGDERLLEIVLENLLGNAWKFTADAARAEVRLGARELDGELSYFVADNGAGFDMAQAARLFGAFQRLHGGEFEGSGIGLATVRRVVHRHGGRVWAEGVPGGGATFYFTLPRA